VEIRCCEGLKEKDIHACFGYFLAR